MIQHTPGPWNVDLETGEIVAGKDKDFAVLGTIYGADDFPCSEDDISAECKANAHLIAAAPELLEAAKKALEDCVDLIATEAGIALEKAIAKAEGG